MEKITLSLHDVLLKKQIKTYAKKRGLTISGIVENYLKNLIKIEKETTKVDFGLPDELDSFLNGIDISEELLNKDYKSLRKEMYANR